MRGLGGDPQMEALKKHAPAKIKRARPIPFETIALLRKTNGPPRFPGIASRRSLQQKRKQNEKPGLQACNPGSRLGGLQILGGRLSGLAVRHDFEGYALAFPQLAKSGALDSADMNEYVLTAAFGLNESITLLRVEPLHGSVVHGSLLIGMSI
jgi:hypothetical protein